MKKTKITASAVSIAAALLVLISLYIYQSGNPAQVSREGFALNTFIKITLYNSGDESILDECFNIINKYENMFSRTVSSSEVYALNHSGEFVRVSYETYSLIEKSIEYSRKTGGKYDITIAPAVDLWDFSSPSLPDKKILDEKITLVSYKNIELAPNLNVRLLNGAQIDLGSIAKGYIADVLAEYLRQSDIDSAIIDLGGNIYALGKKNKDTDWKIGILEPFSENGEITGHFEVSDLSVVTSGIYQRYFYLDGEIYHHILDPLTGFPVKSGLASVSVVCGSSADADALSTSCLLLGLERAKELIESSPGAEAVFITEDGGIFYSSGIGSKVVFTPNRHYFTQASLKNTAIRTS